MAADYRIISIGTLAAHPLWNEKAAMRTGHATCTLIESRAARIVVNPSLPPKVMAALMSERSPLRPADVTHVFLTSYDADHRRGITAFADAAWLIHEPELTAVQQRLAGERRDAIAGKDAEAAALLANELDVLGKCEAAEDSLAPGVDLFPLPGVSPGLCGLLINQPASTVLVAGDAVASVEHLQQAKVLPLCANHEQAMESFREALEIADVIVPGRDNVVLNPARMRM